MWAVARFLVGRGAPPGPMRARRTHASAPGLCGAAWGLEVSSARTHATCPSPGRTSVGCLATTIARKFRYIAFSCLKKSVYRHYSGKSRYTDFLLQQNAIYRKSYARPGGVVMAVRVNVDRGGLRDEAGRAGLVAATSTTCGWVQDGTHPRRTRCRCPDETGEDACIRLGLHSGGCASVNVARETPDSKTKGRASA